MELTWQDYVGYVGMGFALASMSVRTIIPLRLFAMCACVAFSIYTAAHGAWPNLIVNTIALPIHAYRVWEMRQLTRRIASAVDGDLNVEWLKPYMAPHHLAAGDTVFRKGDIANEMFYVSSGRLRIIELDIELRAGELLGEIGMFSTSRRRTYSAVAIDRVELLAISESNLLQLYHQNPKFGFYLIQLVTRRLVGNVERMEAQAALAANVTCAPAPEAA
jgi:CRP/FNR family transcriptional regulator, cyclic AMP receptor protein